MSQDQNEPDAKAGQRAALIMAGTGVFWICATGVGSALELPTRTRALFDLAALAGFGLALWMTYQLWRDRRNNEGND